MSHELNLILLFSGATSLVIEDIKYTHFILIHFLDELKTIQK